MAELNFNLLNPNAGPNVGEAVGYFEAGQKARKMRDRERALASGDLAALRAIDPEAAAQLERQQIATADRQAKITGAQSAARGDWKGARDAYAGAGDIGAVSDVDEMHNTSTKKIAEEATFLKGILAKSGPDAMLAAYDQRAATYGGTPEQVGQIREALATNPDGTLTALAGAPTYKYQRDANGGIIAVNEATGEAEEIHKGQRPAPSGFQWNAAGTAVEPIPGYVDGVGAVSGARRDAVVERPMKKTGGKAQSGGKRDVRAYSDEELRAIAGVR